MQQFLPDFVQSWPFTLKNDVRFPYTAQPEKFRAKHGNDLLLRQSPFGLVVQSQADNSLQQFFVFPAGFFG